MALKSGLYTILILFMFVRTDAQEIDLLILNRDDQQALARIDQLLESEPTAELYFKKGLVLKKLMNYEQAVLALKAATRTDSTETVYLEELAETFAALGNYTDAALWLQRAAHLDPVNLPVKAKLGQCLVNLKKYDQACEWYGQIWCRDSTNLYYNRYYAFAAYQAGKADLAVKLYEQLVNRNSRDINVYLNLATVYAKRKENMIKGVIACRRGLNQFPDQPALLLKWGDLYFQNKDYANAQFPYERYLAKNDSVYEVLRNYGICLYHTDFEEPALQMLNKCYRQNINDPIVNFYIGACYNKLKNFPESIRFFELAAATAIPGFLSDIYHHLGQAYGQQREFKKSIEAYQEAFRLDPSKVELLLDIATTYEEFDSNTTMALNYYQIYLKEAGEKATRADYALERLKKLKEELFFAK